MSEDLVLVEIHGIAWDPVSKSPIVVLRDPEGGADLPIWIGLMEAAAISSELEKVSPPRPMTHDLLNHVIGALGAEVSRVAVTTLVENTFFATITLRISSGSIEIDARPSDSIALAVRTGSPIYVAREILERARIEEKPAGDAPDEAPQKPIDVSGMNREEIDAFLRGLPIKDFGKYKM
ncbi:MAG: bifunctional nuclease family protein [Myxococcales bacterium]|nr:bifunctional nuclease family protein [Myxococcales bacterium]